MGTAAYGGKQFNGRTAASCERPIGATSCRPQHTQVSCQPPPPTPQKTSQHAPLSTPHLLVENLAHGCPEVSLAVQDDFPVLMKRIAHSMMS